LLCTPKTISKTIVAHFTHHTFQTFSSTFFGVAFSLPLLAQQYPVARLQIWILTSSAQFAALPTLADAPAAIPPPTALLNVSKLTGAPIAFSAASFRSMPKATSPIGLLQPITLPFSSPWTRRGLPLSG
jgi:hypothetical protein